MVQKIIGLFWMGISLFCFIKPSFLKNWLRRKSLKNLRRWLFYIFLTLVIYLAGAIFKSKGLLAKAILSLGILAIIKGFTFFKSAISSRLIKYFSHLPLYTFRLVALSFILIGVILFLLAWFIKNHQIAADLYFYAILQEIKALKIILGS